MGKAPDTKENETGTLRLILQAGQQLDHREEPPDLGL
jgi:hypothetical protein